MHIVALGLSLFTVSGSTLCCGVWASHFSGFPRGGACRLQELWCIGLFTPGRVESSRAKDRIRVHCTGRRTLNHWTTRVVPFLVF